MNVYQLSTYNSAAPVSFVEYRSAPHSLNSHQIADIAQIFMESLVNSQNYVDKSHWSYTWHMFVASNPHCAVPIQPTSSGHIQYILRHYTKSGLSVPRVQQGYFWFLGQYWRATRLRPVREICTWRGNSPREYTGVIGRWWTLDSRANKGESILSTNRKYRHTDRSFQ